MFVDSLSLLAYCVVNGIALLKEAANVVTI